MRATEYSNSRSLQAAIAISLVIVFVADAMVPRGFAVWVLYLVPVMLSLFGWRPRTPVVVSAVATGLTVIGFMIDVPGVARTLSVTNRGFGMLTMWTVAVIGRQFLLNKISIDQQGWLRACQNELSHRIQGGLPLPVLADHILTFLAACVEAQTASFYIRESDGTFRRYFSYCADPDAPAAREIVRAGEGFAGQAIKDKQILQIPDLPESYCTFSSTMGKASIRHLVAAPAIADGEAEALVEFGFVHTVNPLHLKFIEIIGETIGVAARTARYRSRLEELLRETQRQAEELQNQQAELEETNTQLEEQTTALEHQKRELTQTQTDLKRHAAELEKASQYKSEFLANMSHELRTPLNSTLILARLLSENKEGNLTPDQVKFAETIHSAGSDLLDLINDVLDLSRIEAGKIAVKPERVPLKKLFENLTRMFDPIATEKGIRFETVIEDGSPQTIVTDAQRLEQILKNLLSNAVKFTDRGVVNLKVEAASPQLVRFQVVDSGIGIAPHQHQVIFEAFRQADGSTHRKYGGTGLGLSISRDLAQLLGGWIEVESAPGKGSTFTLTVAAQLTARAVAEPVPAKKAATAAAAGVVRERRADVELSTRATAQLIPDDRAQVTPSTRTLLIVEDDLRFANILLDLGHEEGFRCIVAGTAAEALALAETHIPRAIVLDVNLPDESGLYVLDQLKRNPVTRHIPVHVASVSDYTQTALELGAVSYALKPVRREELAASLRKVQARMDRPIRRVLVVEDDDRQRDSICRLLQLPDVEIDAVATAAETLGRLNGSVYDCLVMDLGLEDMSGYELLDRMAAEEAYSFPPVIIYTGKTLSAPDEQRLLQYSKSIIIKGARSPERLLDEVTLFLHEVETRLSPDRQQMLRLVRDRDAALEGRRVLVVEDDVRNVFAITSILEPKGAQVEIARTGLEAIATLERASRESTPVDLVLMDIMMPEMDGITAIRKIREHTEWARLPILALTAKAMPDDREQCIDAGANDYISKPLDVNKLLSLVRVWIGKPAA